MNDLERERDFYRQQCNELGARLLLLQREQAQARQEARFSRTTARLIREVYRLADTAVSLPEMNRRFLQIIQDTLHVDRLALLKYQPDSGSFVAEHTLGFSKSEPLSFSPPHLPDDYYFVNSTSPAGPLGDCLRQAAGAPYLAWAFDAQAGLALLLGNVIEDQHLHPPFEIGHREILEGALTVFIDITARQRLEMDLSKFKLGIERSSDAFFLTDIDGVITYVNSAFEEIYGFSQAEAVGKTPRILKSGLISAEHYQYFWETLLDGGTVTGEIVNRTKDGRLVHIAGNNNPILDEAGKIIGFLSIHRDITAQKQANTERERLLSEVQRLAGIVRNQPDFIGIGSLAGETFYVNPAGLKMLGLPPDYDVTHLNFKELIPSSKIDQFLQEARLSPPVTGSRSWSGEGYLLRADGSQLLVERTVVVNYDADQKPVSLSVTMRDITERKQAEEALRASERRNKTLIEAIPDLIIRFSRDGVYLDIKEARDVPSIIPLADIIGRNMADLLPPEVVERQMRHIERALDTGETQVYEQEFMRAGQKKYEEVRVVPGGANEALMFFRDITDRKQAEETVAKRAAELETVAEVGTAAATILAVDQLLQQVADLTRERFALYHVHIYLLQDSSPAPTLEGGGEGGVLVLAAGAGEVGRHMVAEGWRIPLAREQSLVARAARSRQGVIVNDVQAEPSFLPNPLLPETRSELAVPLLVGDRVLGVLDVQADEVGRFSEEDVRIQTILAAQIAVALENAGQHQRTQTALTEVQQSQELLRSVIDATPDWILVKDREHRFRLVNQGFANSIHLTPAEIVGKNDIELGFPEEIVKGNPEKGIRGFWADDLEVMDGGQMKIIESEPAVIDGQPAFLNTIKVPMRNAQGEVWGVLAYVRNITSLKQAEESMAKRAAELACLNDIGRELESSPPLAELLHWVSGRIPAAMQYPHLCAAAIEYAGQLYGEAAALKLPTQMTHGLYVGGEIVGRITIAYTEKHDFLNEESALLGGIANRLSGYIENRRLFEQAQTRAEREQILREVTNRIRGSVDVQTIMRIAAQEVGRVLGRPAFVYLGNGGNGEQSSTGPGEKEA